MFKTLIPPAIPDPEEPDLFAPWTDDVLCVSYADLWALSMRSDATAEVRNAVGRPDEDD